MSGCDRPAQLTLPIPENVNPNPMRYEPTCKWVIVSLPVGAWAECIGPFATEAEATAFLEAHNGDWYYQPIILQLWVPV